MPDAKFLEEYPLYRKFDFDLYKVSTSPTIKECFLHDFPEINISMYCSNCKDIRTFRFTHKYIHEKEKQLDIVRFKRAPPPILEENDIINLNYVCAYCEKFHWFFAIKIGENLKVIKKVGQYPAWDINIEKNLKKLLGSYLENYQKGKTCESQSYGIGAFAYYRRIVEDIIEQLLESIPDLMSGEELEKYQVALEEVRKTKNISDKIALVKDLLPLILKPEQFNPLKTIYNVLSTGIHGKTDEQCLADAKLIRTSLIFLVDSILSRSKGQQEYTESMKKIIETQRKKIKRDENKDSSDDRIIAKRRK